MRFLEYESREIVKRGGIPVTQFGFATTADEAVTIARQINGPVVIKSQVLTGGRMKAGGVQFADQLDQVASLAEQVLGLEINGHEPRGVLIDSKAAVKQDDYAGVVWAGIRKHPGMLCPHLDGTPTPPAAHPLPPPPPPPTSSTLLPPTAP